MVRRAQDVLAQDIARDLERQGFHIDVENVEAAVAKMWAARQDETAAFIKKSFRKIEAQRRAAVKQLIPPAVRRKKEAADIRREHEALVEALRRSGVDNPSTQAWEELAERYGCAHGDTLYRRVHRNR
jgi:hypothetical protein